MKNIIFILAFFCLTVKAFSQTPTCDDFCISSIQVSGTDPSILILSLDYQGDGTGFINYPYFSHMMDNTGDTIATGSMSFFGQFSNSTQDYEVSLESGETYVSGQVYSAYFVYDDTLCELYFPCGIASVNEEELSVTVFPNPASSLLQVNLNQAVEINSQIALYNELGQCVLLQDVTSNSVILSIHHLPEGVYTCQISTPNHTYFERILVLH